MEGTKNWYQSKAVWGGAVALAASLANALGTEVSLADQADMIDALANFAGAIGGILAIYGRLAARTSIRGE